jgi:hypothetical protein
VEINETISPDDLMFAGNLRHYLSCGQSALRLLRTAIDLAGAKPPKAILDFGAGAGRVTRWLVPSFPDSAIRACDVRRQDMEFVAANIGVEAWTVDEPLNMTNIRGPYDLIWAGSVITHLSEVRTRQVTENLLSSCNDHGLLVMSFHGRYVIERQETGKFAYIHDRAWHAIRAGYNKDGFGFARYRPEVDYGVSVCSPEWVVDLVRSLPSTRLVMLGERLWDSHHDVFAIQKQA